MRHIGILWQRARKQTVEVVYSARREAGVVMASTGLCPSLVRHLSGTTYREFEWLGRRM